MSLAKNNSYHLHKLVDEPGPLQAIILPPIKNSNV